MRTEASGVTCDDQASGAPASAFRPGSAGWGRGIAAGLLAAAVALVLVNRAALPGLHALLPPALVLPVLICGVGPAIEELCKFGAFRLLVRPARRGWRAYWAVGLTFGVLEALLKLSPLLLTAMSDGSGDEASLARLAGAATSLLLHGALGGLVAVVATGGRQGGRAGLAVLLAGTVHMGFNASTTLAVLALARVAGEPGAKLAVWLALLLALCLLLLSFALPRRRRHRPPSAALTT